MTTSSTPMTFDVEAPHADTLRKSRSAVDRNFWLFESAKQAMYQAHRAVEDLGGVELRDTRIEITFNDMTATATLHLPTV